MQLITVVYTCLVMASVKLGYLGRHTWMLVELPPSQIDMVLKVTHSRPKAYKNMSSFVLTLLQMFAGVTFMNIISLFIIKSSILWFFHRLGPSKRMRYTIFTVATLNIIFAVIAVVLACLRCQETNEAWHSPGEAIADKKWKEGKKCVSAKAQASVTPALNIAINLLIFSLPVPFIWKLDIPRKQKIGAVASFTLGGL
jgi:hypothetical protein